MTDACAILDEAGDLLLPKLPEGRHKLVGDEGVEEAVEVIHRCQPGQAFAGIEGVEAAEGERVEAIVLSC